MMRASRERERKHDVNCLLQNLNMLKSGRKKRKKRRKRKATPQVSDEEPPEKRVETVPPSLNKILGIEAIFGKAPSLPKPPPLHMAAREAREQDDDAVAIFSEAPDLLAILPPLRRSGVEKDRERDDEVVLSERMEDDDGDDAVEQVETEIQEDDDDDEDAIYVQGMHQFLPASKTVEILFLYQSGTMYTLNFVLVIVVVTIVKACSCCCCCCYCYYY